MGSKLQHSFLLCACQLCIAIGLVAQPWPLQTEDTLFSEVGPPCATLPSLGVHLRKFLLPLAALVSLLDLEPALFQCREGSACLILHALLHEVMGEIPTRGPGDTRGHLQCSFACGSPVPPVLPLIVAVGQVCL